MTTAREVFAPDGFLARQRGPDYKYRASQVLMAVAVEAAIAQEHHVLVEAGTGTGKSLFMEICATI